MQQCRPPFRIETPDGPTDAFPFEIFDDRGAVGGIAPGLFISFGGRLGIRGRRRGEAAELGGMTLEEIASRLSLTCERVRQIQQGALAKVWRHLRGSEGRNRASTVGMRRRPRIAA